MKELSIIKPNYNRDKHLLASLRQKVYYPPIVGECRGKLYLIDGYLRWRFGKQAAFTHMFFNSLDEVFEAVVATNTATRQLHLIEKAFLIVFAKEHGLKARLASLLKIKIDEETVLAANRIVTLPEFYLDILQGQKPTFKHVEPIFYFDTSQLEQLQKIFENCRFSQSNFYGFLSDLRHYLKISGIAFDEFLQNAQVGEILQKKLSAYEKGEELLLVLSRKIKPHYHSSLEKLACIKARLGKNSLEVSYGANFEDDYCKLTFKLSTRQDMENLPKLILNNKESLRELLEVIHCED